jgi:regulator of chromosome condensation
MGDLFVCGYGDAGQLGLGIEEMEKSTPTFVNTNHIITDICAGGMHSLFLTKCGKVFSFGCNDDFALGRETPNDEMSEFTPQLVALSDKAVKISAGESHSACLLKNGSVWFWGAFRDSFGCMNFSELGCSKKPIQIRIGKTVKDIASGANHLVILVEDGMVYTLGCGEQGQLGRTPLRSSSRESRQSKSLLNPEPVYVKHKLIKAEKIWCTAYGTFIKLMQTDVIFAFGLNNYKQLTDFETNSLIEFHPKPTLLKNIKKIAGKTNKYMIYSKHYT